MLTLRQAIFQFLFRGVAFGLLTTIVTACGGSMTPAMAPNGAAASHLGGSPAISFKFITKDDAADPTFNQLLGISRSRTIVGYYGSGAPGHPNRGYRLVPPLRPNDFVKQNFPGSAQTQVTAINNLNDTVGFWVNGKGVNRGFIHWKGHYTSYAVPGSSLTQILGINNSGLAVGFDTQGSSNFGFVLNRVTGKFTTIGLHGGTNVMATAINNGDAIVGIDTRAGKTIGFLKVGSKYSPIIYPHSTSTTPFGINNKGDIAGAYTDSSGATHGFLVESPLNNPMWMSFDDPNGIGMTFINGINDRLDMVGFYVDSSGNTDGMIITRS